MDERLGEVFGKPTTIYQNAEYIWIKILQLQNINNYVG